MSVGLTSYTLDATELELRAAVGERLRSRREEIEQAIATRVFSISEPPETADPAYLTGMRSSLTAALDYGLAAVEVGERRAPDVPLALITQARRAARSGVGVDVVLRRYSAGYAILLDFIVEEAEQAASLSVLRVLLRGQAAVFDRLAEAVTEEHGRESARLVRSSSQRRFERVRRLLAGESIDPGELDYDFRGFHLGVVGAAPDAEGAIRRMASEMNLRVLCLSADEGRLWAWVGGRRPMAVPDYLRCTECADDFLPPNAVLAFGTPAQGLHGWRVTHRQACTVFSLPHRQDCGVVRYADVGLAASVANDELLKESLRYMYLAPLASERDGGEALRQTLRAFFAAGGNISSAAADLRLNRQTVRNRLRSFEQKIGQPLNDCAAELETALRLESVAAVRG